jgi:hypothetical protein
MLVLMPKAALSAESFPQWGDVPTWGLLVGAIVTAIFAFLAFRKQSEEVRALKDQVRDQHELSAKQTPVLELQVRELKAAFKQRDAETAERHRAHARMISAVFNPPGVVPTTEGKKWFVELINGSAEPVYTLVAAVVYIQGAGPATQERWLELRQTGYQESIPITTVSMLPAGDFVVSVPFIDGAGIPGGRLAAEVAFTDRSGAHWIRRARGQLEELDQDPIRYIASLGLYGPHEFQTPRRLR